VRNDRNTIAKHLDLLSFSPDLQIVYQEVTRSIIEHYINNQEWQTSRGNIKSKAFVFDIDGVLSLQTINLNSFGVPNRTVNLRDGYAIQLAVRKGYHVGIISGSNSREYLKRLKLLG